MSGFYNLTNRRRVQRAIEFLDLIQTSARSNRASSEDVSELVAPLIEKLVDMGVGERIETAQPSTPAPAPGHSRRFLQDVVSAPDVTALELLAIIRLASDRLEEAAFKIRDADLDA